MHHDLSSTPLGRRARALCVLLAASLVLALSGCGQRPTTPAADVPEFTGQQPVAGSTDASGHIGIVSDASSSSFDVSVSDTDGHPVSGATVSYDEVGATAVFVATNPTTGARSIYVKGLSAASSAATGRLAAQVIPNPVTIVLSVAADGVSFLESQAIAQSIGITIDHLPQASPQDGIVEMCMTPMEFAFLTQALAMSQAREMATYSAWGQSMAIGYAKGAVGLPQPIKTLDKLHGILMDLGDLGEVFTSTLADEIERETLREFSANSLGSHDTIRVTFFDFRHQTLLGGTQNSYAWSTAIVTGVDCDPGAFGAQVGSVSFVNGLSNVPRDEDGFVAVQIDPPEAGVKVYLHEAFTDGTTGGRYERRFPAAVTTSNGRANFSVPPNENGASVLTATVPARYASAEQRLTWAPGPNGTISPPIYNFDVSGFRGIVDKPVDFTYAIGNGGDLATCEVDWGEGNGWTLVHLSAAGAVRVLADGRAHDLAHLHQHRHRVPALPVRQQQRPHQRDVRGAERHRAAPQHGSDHR